MSKHDQKSVCCNARVWVFLLGFRRCSKGKNQCTIREPETDLLDYRNKTYQMVLKLVNKHGFDIRSDDAVHEITQDFIRWYLDKAKNLRLATLEDAAIVADKQKEMCGMRQSRISTCSDIAHNIRQLKEKK